MKKKKPTPKPIHPLKRVHHTTVILGMVCAMVLGVLLIGYVSALMVNMLTKDEPEPNTGDLVLPTLNVTATNGYPKLQAALAVTPMAEEDEAAITGIFTTKKWTDPSVTTLTTRYASLLSAFALASSAPVLQDTRYLTQDSTIRAGFSYDLASITNIRTLIHLVLIDANRHAASGETVAALDEVVSVAKLAETLANGRSVLIQHMIADTFLVESFETIRNIAGATKLNANDLKAFIAKLPDGKTDNGYTSAILTEFVGNGDIRNTIDPYSLIFQNGSVSLSWWAYLPTSFVWAVMAPTGTMNFIYLPDQTYRFMVDQTRSRLALAALPCTSEHLLDVPAPIFDLSKLQPFALTTKNFVGKAFVTSIANSFGSLNQRRCTIASLAALTKAAVAARDYEQNEDKLPAELTDLVPAYLPAVPLDPYTGEAVKYNPTKRLVYSLGAGRIDSGGSAPADWRSAKNPSVAIPTDAENIATNNASTSMKVYYIAVGDDGKSGTKVGCGDSAVAVTKNLAKDADDTKNARVLLTTLFDDHSATIGESGLMNALANSRLTVSSITFNNATHQLDVKLTGTLSSGGTCDDPRIEAQLLETLKIFPAPVNITVNNIALDALLSGRGEGAH